MTHAFVVDKRAKSTTSGMEVQTPVTVVEVPPMKIAAVRFYESDILGLRTAGEVWAADVDPLLDRRVNVPKRAAPDFSRFDNIDVDDVRVLAYTQPKLVSGVPKKVPDLMELRIGGGSISERIEYAKTILGTEVTVTDFAPEGAIIDVIAITKGKGFQGAIKRLGQHRGPMKHGSKFHRHQGSNGACSSPSRVFKGKGMPGQMGGKKATVRNLEVVRVDADKNLLLIKGAVPGPKKALVTIKETTKAEA
jgi:large subunit ribosomal protein L3